ncbi:MAG: FAD-dependent oxidoreductase [Bacilli bacterium]|nr:FAD-dependent oxidoreductase [Bacilli bacterium]
MIYDLVIIGMGPAGVSAAIYAKRAGLNVLCLDKAMIGGYVNYIDRIENYPGMIMSGPDLAFKFYEHIKELDIEFINKEVLSVIDGDVKKVVTNDTEYLCKYVLVATGRVPRKLGLDNEEELEGKGISHCALCDGAFYKGKTIAVVGGGDSALQETLYLSNLCEKVYLIHRREEFRVTGSLLEKIQDKDNVVRIMNTNISGLESKDGKLSSILLDSGDELEVDGLFVYVGFVPGTDFANELEITDENGYIIVDRHFESKLKGIYAVGDIIKKEVYQVSTSIGEGAQAAINIIEKCK